jgi:hypothetical protein
MPVFPDPRNRINRPANGIDPSTTAHSQPLAIVPLHRPEVESAPGSSSNPSPPRRTQISERYIRLESLALSAYDANPLFNEHGAAQILGVTAECLKEWRQRRQGPDYIQYGQSGPVRYELSAVMAFRAAHRVEVGKRR